MRSVRRFLIALALLLPVSLPRPAAAQQNPKAALAPVITAGLEAYRNVGIDQAFRAWLRNSPLHWDPALAAPLHSAQEQFGPFQDWDVIAVRGLGSTTRIVYLVLDYQDGPAFAKFVLYRTEQQGWIITNLKFSLEEDAILPPMTLP